MGSVRYDLSEEPKKINTGKLIYAAHDVYEGEWLNISHAHSFSEIFYVLKGRGKFFIDNSVFEVREGHLIFINPNVVHAETSQQENPLEYIVLGISGLNFIQDKTGSSAAEQDFWHYDLRQQEEKPSEDYVICDFSKQKEEILFYLNALLREAEKKDVLHANVLQGILEILLVYLMRTVNVQSVHISEQNIHKDCGYVKRYIDTHYMQPITLDMLADITKIDKFYLAHAFTKTFGISPINYLNSRRIQTSQELLDATDYNISQISDSCGFSSLSYFSQRFRKHTGHTPTEYREKGKTEKGRHTS